MFVAKTRERTRFRATVSSRRTRPKPVMRNNILLPFLALAAAVPAQAEVDFAHQVVPILRTHCAECHMEEAKRAASR